jgi:D-alanyl-D-alanine carboxypeptidase
MVIAASGTTYEQQLQKQIFEPLGLTRTNLPVGPVLPTPFVHGYDVPPSGPPEDLSQVMAAGWAWASGGIVSTPTEVNRFIRGYVGGSSASHSCRRRSSRFLDVSNAGARQRRSMRAALGELPGLE